MPATAALATVALALVAAEPLAARRSLAPAAPAALESPEPSAAASASAPLDLKAWGLEPQSGAPASEPGGVEISVELKAGERVAAVLERAGAIQSQAREVEQLIAARLAGSVRPGSKLIVNLGERTGGKWAIARVALHDAWGTALQISRTPAGSFVAGAAAPAEALRRFRGEASDGLYWSMRAAGVPADAAAEYLQTVGERAVAAADGGSRFDLVVAGKRLVYAALESDGRPSLRRVQWPTERGTVWLDPQRPVPSSTFDRPVAGRVSSGYGHRLHPILRFARFHRGVDFAAGWGSPVHAAADGVVADAGWHGGYGRQVRLVHDRGLATSYSHLSGIAARPGTRVRRGEIIGYVGSSGLSTGPHLHFELHADGRAVDPQRIPAAGADALDPSDIGRIRQRLATLLAVEPEPAAANRRAV